MTRLTPDLSLYGRVLNASSYSHQMSPQAATVSNATCRCAGFGTTKFNFSKPMTWPSLSFISTISSPVSSLTYSAWGVAKPYCERVPNLIVIYFYLGHINSPSLYVRQPVYPGFAIHPIWFKSLVLA